MALSFEEVKAKLEKLDGGSDMLEAITVVVETEKSKGVEAHRKVNKEAQGLRKYKQALEALGYTEDDELDEFTTKLVEKTTKKQDDEGGFTNKALNAKLKSLEQMLISEKNRSSEFEKKAKNKTIINKLTQELNEKVYGSDLLINSLIYDGKVDLNGDEVVFKNGDDVIDMKSGISKLLEQRKDIAKNTQKGGAGTQPSNMLPPNISEILKSGDKAAISANLKDIKASLGLK